MAWNYCKWFYKDDTEYLFWTQGLVVNTKHTSSTSTSGENSFYEFTARKNMRLVGVTHLYWGHTLTVTNTTTWEQVLNVSFDTGWIGDVPIIQGNHYKINIYHTQTWWYNIDEYDFSWVWYITDWMIDLALEIYWTRSVIYTFSI